LATLPAAPNIGFVSGQSDSACGVNVNVATTTEQSLANDPEYDYLLWQFT
jgi:hypothetical protein